LSDEEVELRNHFAGCFRQRANGDQCLRAISRKAHTITVHVYAKLHARVLGAQRCKQFRELTFKERPLPSYSQVYFALADLDQLVGFLGVVPVVSPDGPGVTERIIVDQLEEKLRPFNPRESP